MITEEQIKNLKPGDPLIIQGTFETIYDDGDICVRVNETDTFSDDVITNTKYIHPSSISLPSESTIKMFHSTVIPEVYTKYDPCRKFRKGDIVEPTEINGRLPQELRGCYRYEVIVGEGEMTNPLYVALKPLLAANYKHLSEIGVNVAFLKLVTPVEELEPYYIEESTDGSTIVLTVKKRDCSQGLAFRFCPGWGGNIFFSETHCRNHAEAERDRLNDEYRKESEND